MNHPTRVVHLTTAHPSTDVRVFWKECRGLAMAGFDVVLLTADKPVSDKTVRVETVKHPSNRLIRFAITGAYLFVAALRTRGTLFHAHDPDLLPYLQVLRLLGKRVIFDMHEDTPKSILSKDWLPLSSRAVVARVYKYVERILLTGIPVVFAEDSYAVDYGWIKQSAVVRNYPILADVRAAARNVEEEQLTLIYAGAISEARGSVTCIEAVAECRKRGLEVRLVLIGSLTLSHREELMALVTSQQLQDWVTILGPVEPPVVWSSISRAQIGLALLHDEPNYVASIPTKILEYMTLGKPVVASNFQLYRQIVGVHNCGFCVDPTSLKDVADALERLVRSPDLRRALGENGAEVAQSQFDWTGELNALVAFYTVILGSQGFTRSSTAMASDPKSSGPQRPNVAQLPDEIAPQ
jgi:glycosyltransferase involved in cell wall biosynthesis